MSAERQRGPTDAELEILQVLWRRGPSTVRQVHEELFANREIGYTTVLKLLQIMTEKRLVERDHSQRAHVYAAAQTEEHTQERLLGHLLDRAFSGSTSKMVMRALSDKRASRDELEAIRQLLDELDEDKGGKSR